MPTIKTVPVPSKQDAARSGFSAVELRTDFAVVSSNRHEESGLSAQVFAWSDVGGVG
jgi:hypothetical protein